MERIYPFFFFFLFYWFQIWGKYNTSVEEKGFSLLGKCPKTSERSIVNSRTRFKQMLQGDLNP